MGELADQIENSINSAEESNPTPNREQVQAFDTEQKSKEDVTKMISEAISIPGEDHEVELIEDEPDWDQSSSAPEYSKSPAREDLHTAMSQALRAEAVLQHQYNQINWNELREDDPAEFAALRLQYKDQFSQLKQQKDYLSQIAGEMNNGTMQKQQTELNEYIQNEQAKLMNVIPAWRNDKVREKEARAMRKYLKDSGFTDGEIDSTLDHRQIKLVRDAMLAEQKLSKANKVKVKRKKQGPKVNYTNEEKRWMKDYPTSRRAAALRIREIIN
ncbi:hypothetical protein A3193_18540 [Candidatus Thiodiazotropha endoloripes]|uniref:hypothetical protein n=1 Tax=Candidatus Thiodiazotropha endoloripes TaxID=1818881 RepID=UPI00083CB8AA|nr:hypothetical protein [Candidatus Thiodiazotropha endoloripes]ODB82748.1 hypothetical protein A3193_18540 [Candidatus Thiodiazotropha endoloripes]